LLREELSESIASVGKPLAEESDRLAQLSESRPYSAIIGGNSYGRRQSFPLKLG
jgi:hypothetical protein